MLTSIKKWISRLVAIAMIFTFLAPIASVKAASGTINLSTNLTTGAYNFYDAWDHVIGSGTGMTVQHFDLPLGGYYVEFLDTPGYITPATKFFNLTTPSQVIDFVGEYSVTPAPVYGSLDVSTNLTNGAYNVYDAWDHVIGSGVGMTVQHFDLPLGAYYVEFLTATGYITPATQHFNLISGQTLTAYGQYTVTPPTTGTLSVNTDQALGSYNVYDVNDKVIGAGSGTNATNFDLTPGAYYVEFLDSVPGYAAPAIQHINVLLGSTNTVTGHYTNTGTVQVNVTDQFGNAITNASYTLLSCTGTLLPTCTNTVTTGNQSATFTEVAGTYAVAATLTGAYTSVVITSLNPQALAIGGTTTFSIQYSSPTSAILQITTTPVVGAISVDGVLVGTPTAPGAFVSTTVDITAAHTISFGAVGGYTAPANIVIAANTLVAGSTTQHTGTYTVAPNTAFIQVTTTPALGEVFLDGISLGTPTAAGTFLPLVAVSTTTAHTISFGTVASYLTPVNQVIPAGTLAQASTTQYTGTYIANNNATLQITTTPVVGAISVDGVLVGTPTAPGAFVSTTVDITAAHTISFGAVGGYTAPANIVIAANTLAAGSTTQHTGTYTVIAPSNNATLQITTTPVTGEIFIDGASIGTPAAAGTFLSATIDRTLAHTISFGAVANYTAPTNIVIAGGSLAGGSTTQYTGTYIPVVVTTATIRVTTQPFAGEIFVNGVSIGTPTAAGTFISATVDITVPNVITFANVAGYQSPLITIPANTLVGGSTTQYTGTYTNEFILTKTVSAATVGDNQLITYTITLKRNTTTPGIISVNITDSISQGTAFDSDIIPGASGGSMAYLINSATCTGVTCTGNISALGGVTVTMDDATSVATITYQARSSNAGIATNGTSVVTSTTKATYGANTLNAQALVTIQGPTGGGNGGGGNGGGSGSSSDVSGGGHKLLTGDMKLEIQKLVSLDGTNFVDASLAAIGFVIPEKTQTRLYTKLIVKNVGDYSAAMITLDPFFTKGDSDMVGGEIENLVGARLNSASGNMILDKVSAGKSAEITYSRMIDEQGQNMNYAIDGIKLLSFGSRLPDIQDGLTYKGIGDSTNTYLFAGQIPVTNNIAVTSDHTDALRLTLSASETSVRVGEEVALVLTATNLTDKDLTGLYINFDYDQSDLAILKAIGSKNDGDRLTWTRLILRPGETVTFNVQAKVTGGTDIRNVATAMVNEFESTPTVEQHLTVVSGAARALHLKLAQTGALSMTLMILMLALAGLGYKSLERRRYARMRARALMPL